MTTFVFVPKATQVFQFQPTLDRAIYTAIVTWNAFGQRWYLNLYTLQDVLIFCLPLIGSPDDYDIDLAGGYFTSTLIFRESSQTFEVTP